MACSGKQSKFWDYHAKVFAEDAGLIHSSNLTAALAESAGSIGLDKNAFTACLSSTNVEADIQKDIAVAQQLHVLGTPTMYINGKPILAVQSIELLRSTIDAELSQASLK